MTVKELMTSDVKACGLDADLASVAGMMWECDCGAVPIVNDDRQVVGKITDRDICIASATRCTAPQNIGVREVMAAQVHACAVKDEVRTALNTMKEHRVRRLPVLDDEQRLAGMISVNDLVQRAECRQGAEVPGDQFLATLKAICEHSTAAVAA